MGFWVFGSKIKNTGFSPPFAPFAANHTPGPFAGARARFFAAQNPGKLLCNHQVCCCFASLSDPRAVFSAGDGHADRAGPLPWNKHLVLPGGGARPPVGLLSLTSFSAGDLVPRPCMSSSPRRMAAPPVAFVCYVIAFRVPSCPPPFLSSSTGSSHSSRSFCIQGATEVQDLPGPGECACWTFLLTPTPCLTPSCDKERAEAPVHRKKELLFFCEAGRPAKGRRGVFARMEGVPWCHVVDSMAAGSRYKL